jgi:hypothetical protein
VNKQIRYTDNKQTQQISRKKPAETNEKWRGKRKKGIEILLMY